MIPAEVPLLRLSSDGGLIVELAPELGGSIASFRLHRNGGRVDLLRPLTEAARHACNPEGVAMFPMLPYANRIANNHFEFNGCSYKVRPNGRGQDLNLHGSGWTSAWTVAKSTMHSADLRLDHIAADDPFSYSAYQHFELGDHRLEICMGVTHRGAKAMPFGLGWHPWLPRHPDATLRFGATHFWLEGPDHLATDRISIPPELDFSDARPLPTRWRNNCYSGWDGRAEVRFPSLGVGIRFEADPALCHLVLYCDPSQAFFCIEPQTHAIGALNRLDPTGSGATELIVLEPQECCEVRLVLIAFELGYP
jgi:aldose 1-epimerase